MIPRKLKESLNSLRVHSPAVIALSETKKMDFSPIFLETLVSFGDFTWQYLPANGTTGGILLGIDLNLFDPIRWNVGLFYVSCDIKNKVDGFSWKFVAVYGPAYENLKQQFLDEITSVCNACTLPILVGGDFNLIRQAKEKKFRQYTQELG